VPSDIQKSTFSKEEKRKSAGVGEEAPAPEIYLEARGFE
jgi:hypothetical protein